jgi:hypothetical protein
MSYFRLVGPPGTTYRRPSSLKDETSLYIESVEVRTVGAQKASASIHSRTCRSDPHLDSHASQMLIKLQRKPDEVTQAAGANSVVQERRYAYLIWKPTYTSTGCSPPHPLVN